jgi:phage shock protein PspC (stress-responsive transcriptional regulator)
MCPHSAAGQAFGMTSAPHPSPPHSDPQQPDPQHTGTAQLRRSGTDKMLGGVSGGLAEYSGIDPLLWRVGFVGLTLAGGSGILVYLLLWVLMPSGPLSPDETPSPLDRLITRLHTSLVGTRTTPPGS